MGLRTGTMFVGDGGAVQLCPVTAAGVMVKNLGGSTIFVGGPDVGTEGTQGFAAPFMPPIARRKRADQRTGIHQVSNG